MGSDSGGEQDEHPAHTVTLPAFWLDQTEVTNAAYAECVAAKAGVDPDREPAYVAGFWQTEGLLAAEHFDPAAARARLRDFAAAFPGAPGVELLTCDLELRANHAALAAQHCDKALAQAKEASRAYFLLGLIATRAHRDNVAESRLRSAILLDPETPDAWRALAKLYRALGAHARLAELDDKHRVLFSTPLPE